MNNEVVDPIGAVFLDSPLNFRPHIFMIFFFFFFFLRTEEVVGQTCFGEFQRLVGRMFGR